VAQPEVRRLGTRLRSTTLSTRRSEVPSFALRLGTFAAHGDGGAVIRGGVASPDGWELDLNTFAGAVAWNE
jgi:hypothetical protein